MQLKLLNFHKMLANFSTSLVGGFVPLMIYKVTNNIVHAFIYLIGLYALNMIFNLIFQRFIVKYPQIFLLFRSVSILGLSLSILLIDVHWIWGAVLVATFYALDNCFRSNSTEIILNYSTSDSGGKGLGITRLFEQLGTIVSLILGGLFLDYLDLYILIIIAISIYLISCVPLLIYYIKSRKQKGFNTESTSNAQIFIERTDRTKKGKKVANSLIMQYGFVYFLIAFLDNLKNIFNLFMYVKYGQFALAGYFSATYNLTYAIASYLNEKVSQKFDMSVFACIWCLINGAAAIALPFANYTALYFTLIGIIGFCYPFFSIFILERLLSKSRILGISNRAIFMRDNASVMGKFYGLLFGLTGMFIPMFIAIGAALATCAPSIYENEESTRRYLINYLEGE